MIINMNRLGGGGGSPYVLPIASENTLGGVKVGTGLTIDEGGVLSAEGGDEGVKDLETMSQQELNALAEDIIAKWQEGYQFKDFYLVEGKPVLGWGVQNEVIINPYVIECSNVSANVRKLSYWLTKNEDEEDWRYYLWSIEDMPANKYIRANFWESEGNISLVNIEGSSATQEILAGDTQATIQFVYSNFDLGLKNQGTGVIARTGEYAYKFYCEIFEGSNRYAVIMTADNEDFSNPTTTKTLITSGSVVSWSQIITGGTKIAEISIDGTTTDVYAPEGVEIDDEMSDDSENAVQNKVIKSYIDNIVGNVENQLAGI